MLFFDISSRKILCGKHFSFICNTLNKLKGLVMKVSYLKHDPFEVSYLQTKFYYNLVTYSFAVLIFSKKNCALYIVKYSTLDMKKRLKAKRLYGSYRFTCICFQMMLFYWDFLLKSEGKNRCALTIFCLCSCKLFLNWKKRVLNIVISFFSCVYSFMFHVGRKLCFSKFLTSFIRTKAWSLYST